MISETVCRSFVVQVIIVTGVTHCIMGWNYFIRWARKTNRWCCLYL